MLCLRKQITNLEKLITLFYFSFTLKHWILNVLTQSAGSVEYTDCIS